jgi:hypothetical protein
MNQLVSIIDNRPDFIHAKPDLVGLRRTFRLRWAIAFPISQLEKTAPHRVRCIAHSLKRDIGPTAANPNADSQISMTSPRTTLTFGHYAPLSNWSSAVPCSTLPQRSTRCFLGAICGKRADYFAHITLGNAKTIWLPGRCDTIRGDE